MAEHPIHVNSEIGKLKTVLLKRPGREVENITPFIMERLLFDDIPYLPIIQKEHDYFANTLKECGVEVLYLENLAAESIIAANNKAEFVNKMLDESHIESNYVRDALFEYLMSQDTKKMIDIIMAGVRVKDLDLNHNTLYDLATGDDKYPFYMDPMPNLYFTRDPAASIGNGLTINKMTYEARRRESLFMENIIKYHPRFADKGVNIWLNRDFSFHIEGGDELVLSKDTVAIGISQRTTAQAIEALAKNLFKHSNFKRVLAIKIPNNRAMMHLDTVFTMIDKDKFTIHPGIQANGGQVDTYILTPGENDTINIKARTDLQQILKEVLNVSELDLIPCGGGDSIVAPREQWNDGSNTLAVAPNEVITYNRNYVSNDLLRRHGVRVHEVISSELSRGRGGPRCMSMPLVREDLV